MRQSNQAGFTLVEVIVVLIVSAILIGSVVLFAMTNLIGSALSTARSNMLSEAKMALDLVNNDIRLASVADEVNRWPDDHAPQAPTDLFSWSSDDQTLVLATIVEDADNNIIFADASSYISHKNNVIYYLSEGRLYKRLLAADVADNKAQTTCPPASANESCPADRELLSNVEEINFRYIDQEGNQVSPDESRAIEVSVRLKTTKMGRELTVDYVTRMVFRNA